MDTVPVTCPTCFEVFEVPAPPPAETPTEVDYDCEVCCRPMVIAFEPDPVDPNSGVTAFARGIHD
ncbi:MAG: CPXCG motif-containing cysteine-rich protein [Verrucomicrobiales bacterium]|nr:CPXCG motif-containing cysteine-rich protein [Verrucomicrobiales bacterium]